MSVSVIGARVAVDRNTGRGLVNRKASGNVGCCVVIRITCLRCRHSARPGSRDCDRAAVEAARSAIAARVKADWIARAPARGADGELRITVGFVSQRGEYDCLVRLCNLERL